MRSKLIDLNILAIFLVEDHPGHRHVDKALSAGLAGEYRLLMPDHLPLRARWVLTNRWGIPRSEADRAVEDFLEHRRVRYVGASRTTMHKAFELARTLRHDVYDTFFLAMAIDHGASVVLTTDRDFRALCRRVDLEYENPVPDEVLRRFGGFPKTR
jgi:predicted nucleic acid-binding protein